MDRQAREGPDGGVSTQVVANLGGKSLGFSLSKSYSLVTWTGSLDRASGGVLRMPFTYFKVTLKSARVRWYRALLLCGSLTFEEFIATNGQ